MTFSESLTLPVPISPADPEDRRALLQDRLFRLGAPALGDAECLELAADLDESAAEALLGAFGSLPEVLGAAAADLARTAGVGAAARLKAAQLMAERMLSRPLKRRDLLSCGPAVAGYLRAALVGAPREQFRVLFLDRRNRLLRDEVMGWGTVDHAPAYPREVARRALELNAAALLLAHNHPSQDPTPSQADIRMTSEVVAAARALGIAVHDHLIVAGAEVTSLKSLGLM